MWIKLKSWGNVSFFISAIIFPKNCHRKKEPDFGTRLVRGWYELNTKEAGRLYRCDKGTEYLDNSDQFKLRGRQGPREATKELTGITRQLTFNNNLKSLPPTFQLDPLMFDD
jgi:hypothetical protein